MSDVLASTKGQVFKRQVEMIRTESTLMFLNERIRRGKNDGDWTPFSLSSFIVMVDLAV